MKTSLQRPIFPVTHSSITPAVRLKQLKISGFKSFADTTVIEFPSAVLGIVGPNGCGKSNVIDAIRWVLGEARVSELRGSTSMTELIFAGSSGRPASSRASVEMVLDNSDGTVSGAWGRYTELSVRRVVTRDGSNAYFLNGQQVRRRDVQDIFLGTGLGPRSYAIISQGMISNFIKAKPEELRVYLEEAAGVSKYKERRKETESALNTTRSNLEKVALIQENKAQEIERLSTEAEVAQRWRTLEDERAHSELLWYFLQEKEAADAVNKLNAQIAEKEAETLQCQGAAQALVTRIEELREIAREKRAEADEARAAAWQANTRVTEIQGNIRHVIEQKDSLGRQISNAGESMQRRRADEVAANERVALLEAESKRLAEEAAVAEEEAAGLEDEAAERQGHYEDAVQAYENARRNANDTAARLKIIEVEMQSLSRQISDVEERQQSLKNEKATTAVPDEARFAELDEQMQELNASIEEATAEAEDLRGDREEAEEKLAGLQRDQQATAQNAARVLARLQTLQAVQQKAQGEGKLPEWLEKMGLSQAARFYEKLDIEEGWAMAAEAILSVRSSALSMSRLESAAGFSFDPPPARLVFYSANGASEAGNTNSALKPLASVIHTSDVTLTGVISQWCRGVYIAESLDEAVKNRASLGEGERFVTREGHTVDAVSVSFWAEDSEGAGLMSRAAEIRSLTQLDAAERAKLTEIEHAVTISKQRFNDLDVNIKAKEALVARLRNDKHALEVEHSALGASLAAWRARNVRIDEDIKSLKEKAEELMAQRDDSEEKFAALDEEVATSQQAAASAQELTQEAERLVAECDERLRELQSTAQMNRMQVKTATERIEDARSAAQSAREEIARFEEQVEELRASLEELDESAEREGLTQVLEELEAKKVAQSEAETASDDAENNVEAARTRYQELTDEQAPRLQAVTDLKVKRESWSTQSLAFTSRLDELEADRTALSLEVSESNLKTSTLKNKVGSLAQQIAELGAVNHAALENLETCRRTMEETERQVKDLEAAIANLESTIRKIDADTRELLRATFDVVNKNFGEIFQGLFSGGSASLKMTGDEILESGVEVIAQPPGKRNANTRLLSGGEQAMTATALVFAIFKLNPAPFCLLDEVDAPLDEANQDRLARRIIAMSDSTQFMMITHHRVSMEHMRQLVGVTMKEPGVSRVVAVDVQEAATMAKQTVAK